jgi:hypothetical protein
MKNGTSAWGIKDSNPKLLDICSLQSVELSYRLSVSSIPIDTKDDVRGVPIGQEDIQQRRNGRHTST